MLTVLRVAGGLRIEEMIPVLMLLSVSLAFRFFSRPLSVILSSDQLRTISQNQIRTESIPGD